ncbi:hypothetical protein H845_1384 [Komagataeibacter xylinus E25]|nr:hypothetical protein H845_1384 [Komagataeibacter xylinus E25]
MPDTLVIDFDIPGPIVSNRDMFWNPIHYRLMTAARIMNDIITAFHDPAHPSADHTVISGPQGPDGQDAGCHECVTFRRFLAEIHGCQKSIIFRQKTG